MCIGVGSGSAMYILLIFCWKEVDFVHRYQEQNDFFYLHPNDITQKALGLTIHLLEYEESLRSRK